MSELRVFIAQWVIPNLRSLRFDAELAYQSPLARICPFQAHGPLLRNLEFYLPDDPEPPAKSEIFPLCGNL
jgi:hypothetical protein